MKKAENNSKKELAEYKDVYHNKLQKTKRNQHPPPPQI